MLSLPHKMNGTPSPIMLATPNMGAKSQLLSLITSRKHGEKEPRLFSRCGSFDHHDLQSYNDYKFYFSICDCKSKCLGACDIPLEGYFRDLSNGRLQASKYLKCQLLSQEKQSRSCLAIEEHGGQKNRNGKTTAVLFHHVF